MTKSVSGGGSLPWLIASNQDLMVLSALYLVSHSSGVTNENVKLACASVSINSTFCPR